MNYPTKILSKGLIDCFDEFILRDQSNFLMLLYPLESRMHEPLKML